MRLARLRFIPFALLAAALIAAAPVTEEPEPPVFAIAQLDALLAPVALYPDSVLAPLLMAAEDPLQIVLASRWAAQPGHAALAGDALAQALAGQDWDPDVKALVAYPGLLTLLDRHLAWTMQVGYAVADQLPAVLDSVRRLRRQAMTTGALHDGGAVALHVSGTAVAIAPTDPGRVALPDTDPKAAYGAWPYAGVTPVRLPGIGTAAATVPAPWRDLAGIDWRRAQVVVDVKDWNAANGDRPPITLSVWHPRPVYAVIGRTDVSLGAPPLPPAGPAGRPAPPSGIPAHAIGRATVSVPAQLVALPVAPAALSAPPQTAPPRAGAVPAALQLAPLPARLQTARASALSDIDAGAETVPFARRGTESRGVTP